MTTEIDLTGDEDESDSNSVTTELGESFKEPIEEDIEREAEELISAMEEGDCDCPACQRVGEIVEQQEVVEQGQRERLNRVNRQNPIVWSRGTGKSFLTVNERRSWADINDELEDVKINAEKIVEELDAE